MFISYMHYYTNKCIGTTKKKEGILLVKTSNYSNSLDI